MKHFSLFLILLQLSACAYKSTNEDVENYKHALKHDEFSLTGSFSWSFDLMGGTQLSTHTFSKDEIHYKMEGLVHNAEYSLHKLSYSMETHKWIGESPDHIVYVLFFKDETDSTIAVYKHKCKAKGLEEAINFGLPAADATDDHGWNTYTRKGAQYVDRLPINGTFSHAQEKVSISDPTIIYQAKQIEKMSFHTGERRWVGKYQDRYLLVFFQSLEQAAPLRLALSWHDDLEALYQTKYNSIAPENWVEYGKY